jgi:acetyl-CoA synthetase
LGLEDKYLLILIILFVIVINTIYTTCGLKNILGSNMVYPVQEKIASNAHINKEQYEKLYKQSVENPEEFWAKQAESLEWFTPFTKVKNTTFDGDVSIKWFEDGELNVAYNCIDRHLKNKGEQTAIIWEGNEPTEDAKITYNELHKEVCSFSNVLKSQGIKKGDRVIIYMPMILEASYAMLACARIGAVHSVVFGGFSPNALADRIIDCEASIVITADEGKRGTKFVPLKKNVDEALNKCGKNIPVITIQHTKNNVPWDNNRDIWYHEAMQNVNDKCEAVSMNAEDPLFILYTSGSTGKPKGVLHTTGGYILYAAMTHKYVFDYQEGEVYWCTADVGWITGHSYIIYGPLANGAITLMFEGVPTYPDASRCWQVIDKHKVNIFYTAPTAIRALMREGIEPVKSTSRKSLRILGSVGEPINEEAWLWYHENIGNKNCPIVDTWWQTETGGILITPLPGATDLKPGMATRPFFGIQPVLCDPDGSVIEEQEAQGALCIADSWPGQMRTIYGNQQRFIDTYFSTFKGKYFSGDGARRDADGYYRITGRMDDVLNVSGHRLGTAEIEDALDSNPKVVEAAVVGYPHDIKGEGIYAFVILKKGEEYSDELRIELNNQVRESIGAIASPDYIQNSSGLPKTRSGKIMRRILRKIAANDYSDLGDTATLTNPEVIDELIKERKNN